MKIVVPDASVILKWVLPDAEEDGTIPALRLRDAVLNGKILLKAPALWLYEVGNTLTRRFPEQARELIEVLVSFDIEEGQPNTRWLDRVVSLARRYKVTFYDAAYHALALVEKGVFVTADLQYLRKAGKAGGVTALDEWK